MSDIRKFFENSLNFQRYDRHAEIDVYLDTTLYKSKIILDLRAVGIYNSGDIYDRLKSLLYYSASEHISTEHEGYRCIDSSFDIGIMINPGEDDRDYKKLVRADVEPHDDVLEFRESNFIQFDSYNDYSCPIQIHIDANGCYQRNEVAEESEAESEDE